MPTIADPQSRQLPLALCTRKVFEHCFKGVSSTLKYVTCSFHGPRPKRSRVMRLLQCLKASFDCTDFQLVFEVTWFQFIEFPTRRGLSRLDHWEILVRVRCLEKLKVVKTRSRSSGFLFVSRDFAAANVLKTRLTVKRLRCNAVRCL